MTLRKLTTTVSLLALLAAASPALADDDTSSLGPNDSTGLSTLGIDISQAGGSPEAVRNFLAGLAPDTLRGVIGGCQTAVASPSGYAPSVVGFCQNVTGMSGPALGFAQEPLLNPVPLPIIAPSYGVEIPPTVPLGENPGSVPSN